ncbi:MAG: hypothetical protein L6R00_03110 [Phycisphaerae bacterium]|nr:hypothetical protein [Phycisphaerae bacterium]
MFPHPALGGQRVRIAGEATPESGACDAAEVAAARHDALASNDSYVILRAGSNMIDVGVQGGISDAADLRMILGTRRVETV